MVEPATIERAARGDERAWEVIVRAYTRRIYNFAYSYLNDHFEAEDITQEVFFKVYLNLKNFRSGSNFNAWIYSIAKNLIIDKLRQRKRRQEEVPLQSDQAVSSSDPAEEYRRKRDIELVRKAISMLPEEFREIIILRDVNELSYEEISAILNLPMGTVKSRINRARLKLYEILKEMR